MKRIIFILAVITLAGCRPPVEDDMVRLSGTIENAGGQPVEFVYYRDFTNNHREIITLELDAQNQFAVVFDMPEPAMGTLRHGRTNIRLFLEPGDDLHIIADAAHWMESIALTGSAAGNNQCYVNYQRELEAEYTSGFFSNAARDLEPALFVELMDNITEQKRNYLEYCRDVYSLTESFEHFFETEILYYKYTRLLNYPGMHQRFNQLAQLPELPGGYYTFLDQALPGKDRRLNSETYVGFMMAYLNHEAARQGDRFDESLSAQEVNYVLAGELLTGDTRDYLRAININREFNYGDLDKARALKQDFMATSQSDNLKARVNKTWEGIQALMPGNPAPDFTMTDMDGNPVSLSDYRGKVVYLKFWASWCGPCMRQVPPAAELKKRLADEEDLVFMYISIDTDENAWRTTVERNNITGVHMVTPGRERGVPALYQVKWIPTFYIIGRDGNIFDNRPPQPADPEVDAVLLKALAQ